jgi:hypothetical protein
MRGTAIGGLLLAASLVGCGPSLVADVDAGSDPSGDAWTVTDAGPTVDGDDICEDVVDLVFVLDTSSSMGFVLTQLEEDISGVVDAANALAADSHFGLVVFQDNFWIDDTGPLSGGIVHTQAAALQTAFGYYRDNFTNYNRNPGDGLSGPDTQNPICEENSLDALYAAATEFPWRENATRVIILATDDTFLERPDNYGDRDGDGQTDQTDYPSEGDYPALRTMAETVDALRGERVRVFSFTRLTQPGILDSPCGTPRRYPWEYITHGWTQPYDGQDPIPERTDADNFDLALVRDGTLSLAETINQVVVDSYCAPPIL